MQISQPWYVIENLLRESCVTVETAVQSCILELDIVGVLGERVTISSRHAPRDHISPSQTRPTSASSCWHIRNLLTLKRKDVLTDTARSRMNRGRNQLCCARTYRDRIPACLRYKAFASGGRSNRRRCDRFEHC